MDGKDMGGKYRLALAADSEFTREVLCRLVAYKVLERLALRSCLGEDGGAVVDSLAVTLDAVIGYVEEHWNAVADALAELEDLPRCPSCGTATAHFMKLSDMEGGAVVCPSCAPAEFYDEGYGDWSCDPETGYEYER